MNVLPNIDVHINEALNNYPSAHMQSEGYSIWVCVYSGHRLEMAYEKTCGVTKTSRKKIMVILLHSRDIIYVM